MDVGKAAGVTSIDSEQRLANSRLADVVHALGDAMVVADSRGLVILFNAAAERFFGCDSAEATGRPLSAFVPERVFAGRETHGGRLELLAADQAGWLDAFTHTNPQGEHRHIEVTLSHTSGDGEGLFTLLLRDVTGRSAAEAQLRRLNGLYAARSQINRAIVTSGRRHDLLEMVCRSLAEHAGFALAWVGWWAPETDALVPVASSGDASGNITSAKVYVDGRAEGQGPSGNAFRQGRPMIAEDMLTDPRCAPWREESIERGFRSCAALPVRLRGEVCGTLTVYARESGFFKDKEIALLEETVRDVSFALDNFVREEERANAEAAARRERSLFDAMIESTPGILYLYNEQGRFLRWNRRFEDVTGYSAAEIADMRPWDFFPPESKAALEARIADVFAQGSSRLEAPILGRDGQATPYFLTGQRITFDGMACLVGVGIDISDVKQAQSALEANERRFRTTLDNILEGCQLVGFDWRYLYANRAAELQNRRPNSELIGRTMQEAWPGFVDTAAFAPIRHCMEDRVPVSQEVEFSLLDGSVNWFYLRVEPVPEGVFILSIDITERHDAERALRDLNQGLERKVAERTEDLSAALMRAEAADRTKSAFLATMSHELRTPLNSIIGFTGILAQGLAGPVNSEQRKQLGMVRASSRHLLELINDVLDISKIEAGELDVVLRPFDVVAAVRKICEFMTPMAQAKGLTLDFLSAWPEAQLTSDQRRVEQIVLNLVNNAVKFTTEGGVRVTIEPTGDSLRPISLKVADTGIGIKAEDFDALFLPFRQVQTGIARPYEGTGLGLAICRRLADFLNATIDVESEWGRGSTFTLALPLNSGDPP